MKGKKLFQSQIKGMMKARRGLDGKLLTKADIQRHKRLLRECGLPDTLGDSKIKEVDKK
jgi:hypothetical protein